jgi:hypothetical protein
MIAAKHRAALALAGNSAVAANILWPRLVSLHTRLARLLPAGRGSALKRLAFFFHHLDVRRGRKLRLPPHHLQNTPI